MPRISKTTLRDKKEVGGLLSPNFETIYRAAPTKVKAMWMQSCNQGNNTKGTEVSPNVLSVGSWFLTKVVSVGQFNSAYKERNLTLS